jgi:hypothetical protein
MSSYSCRNAYGRAHGRVSEHGKANAVDIGSFVTARGQAALVIADWGLTARQIAAQAAAGQAAADAQTKAPMQPVQGVATIPPGDSNPQHKSAAAQKPPAAASAATVMPLDLRPGMTIGIPGITLDMPGSSDRSLSSFGMAPPNRLGGPKPPASAGPPVTPDGKTDFLRAAHRSACKLFNTVLGPEANNAHLNHFHVDMAERIKNTKICE